MIDPHKLLAMAPIESRQTLTRRDTMLYALGVGATELAYVYEENLQALPTMAVVLAGPGFLWRDPALGADWKKILHGEQMLTLHRPLPPEGVFVGMTRFEAVEDKGPDKGAIVMVARDIAAEDGTPLATVRAKTFLRGDGGCGSAGPPLPVPPPVPERAPDIVVPLPTAPNQALIYRLSGDYNPLHIDPAVAKAGGFAAPILHGLCTYGVTARGLLMGLAQGTDAKIGRIDARFSAPVYPGETIVTEIWHEAPGRAAFRARVAERDLVVLTNGVLEYA